MDKHIRTGFVVLAATVVLGSGGIAVANAAGSDDAPTTPVSTSTPKHDAGDDKGGQRRGTDDPANHDANDDRGRHGADDPAGHDAGDDKGGLR
ncbi:MAG: hypothetical protein QOJ72_1100, partial [Nocardioidaceae bacterium]|nr:hypothetical protein [Nocardioidaceae bacterium]